MFSVLFAVVAPLAGAWIEIVGFAFGLMMATMSLPSRERGLKSVAIPGILVEILVAPLAGAWIEIILYSLILL